jgi:hypothetical protein
MLARYEGARRVMLIAPNNWGDLQHYKDRAPPWIKLHKKLLDNFEFQSLPVASRALAPMLWLLASDHDRGEIDAAPRKLAFRLRMTEREVADALKPLIDNGFFLVMQPASNPLAGGKQAADLEREKRRVEKEEKARAFEKFWAAYPRKEAKRDAEAAWASVTVSVDDLLAAIAAKRKSEDWMKAKGQFIPLPATYLRGKRWEDQSIEIGVTVPGSDKPDPALAKIAADAAKAAPLSAETRAKLAQLRQGAH